MAMQKGSLAARSQIPLPQIHRLLALPSHQQAGVLSQQCVLLGSPFRLIVLESIGLIERPHIPGDAVEPANQDGKSGVVLLGQDRQQLCEFSEGEVLGGQGKLLLLGSLRLDAAVDDVEQVLDLLCELHFLLLRESALTPFELMHSHTTYYPQMGDSIFDRRKYITGLPLKLEISKDIASVFDHFLRIRAEEIGRGRHLR